MAKPIIKNGSHIRVTAEVFDALLRAGLLQRTGTESSYNGTTWPVWGTVNDDETVNCILLVPNED